jgi:hypothetical protein
MQTVHHSLRRFVISAALQFLSPGGPIMQRFILCAATLLVLASRVHGESFYDFDDEIVPPEGTGYAFDQSDSPVTPTVSADGGILTLGGISLPRPDEGGPESMSWFGPEVFAGNVRVSADINPNQGSNDFVGLMLTTRNPFVHYWATFDFSGTTAGRLAMGKGNARLTGDFFWVPGQVSGPLRSFFMELERASDPSSDFPLIAARVFESEDGPLLLEGSFRDNNASDIPPHGPVRAGVFAFSRSGNPLRATFDNLHAVPEPSTLILLSAAFTFAMACFRRRRSAGLRHE